MEQLNAIHTLSQALIKDKAIRALFLKGSLARGDGDEYSDVDLYCLVHDHAVESFLERRTDYLLKYGELLFWTEVDHVGPQIVAVFSNGLHIDLYTVTAGTLQQTDAIKILYDPEGLLSNFQGSFFELNKMELVKRFESLSFLLLEFEAAYKRKNMIWASRLASHISSEVVLLVRHVYDPKRAQLGFKKINNHLPQNVYQSLSAALDEISPTKLPNGLLKLLDIIERVITQLPPDVSDDLNFPFYKYMAEKIRTLC